MDNWSIEWSKNLKPLLKEINPENAREDTKKI